MSATHTRSSRNPRVGTALSGRVSRLLRDGSGRAGTAASAAGGRGPDGALPRIYGAEPQPIVAERFDRR